MNPSNVKLQKIQTPKPRTRHLIKAKVRRFIPEDFLRMKNSWEWKKASKH